MYQQGPRHQAQGVSRDAVQPHGFVSHLENVRGRPDPAFCPKVPGGQDRSVNGTSENVGRGRRFWQGRAMEGIFPGHGA
jgi:hypothetical protein